VSCRLTEALLLDVIRGWLSSLPKQIVERSIRLSMCKRPPGRERARLDWRAEVRIRRLIEIAL
jgi:hypothetical protein